jgi:hypothetical protein
MNDKRYERNICMYVYMSVYMNVISFVPLMFERCRYGVVAFVRFLVIWKLPGNVRCRMGPLTLFREATLHAGLEATLHVGLDCIVASAFFMRGVLKSVSPWLRVHGSDEMAAGQIPLFIVYFLRVTSTAGPISPLVLQSC